MPACTKCDAEPEASEGTLGWVKCELCVVCLWQSGPSDSVQAAAMAVEVALRNTNKDTILVGQFGQPNCPGHIET